MRFLTNGIASKFREKEAWRKVLFWNFNETKEVKTEHDNGDILKYSSCNVIYNGSLQKLITQIWSLDDYTTTCYHDLIMTSLVIMIIIHSCDKMLQAMRLVHNIATPSTLIFQSHKRDNQGMPFYIAKVPQSKLSMLGLWIKYMFFSYWILLLYVL